MIRSKRCKIPPVVRFPDAVRDRIGIGIAHDLQKIQVGVTVIVKMGLYACFTPGVLTGKMIPHTHRYMIDRLLIHRIQYAGSFIHDISPVDGFLLHYHSMPAGKMQEKECSVSIFGRIVI